VGLKGVRGEGRFGSHQKKKKSGIKEIFWGGRGNGLDLIGLISQVSRFLTRASESDVEGSKKIEEKGQ